MSAKIIIEAIKSGDINQIKQFIEDDEKLTEASSPEGLTLVMLAAYYGQMQIAKLIASHKKEISAIEATALGKSQVIIKALNENPDILHVFSNDGFTLLGLASFFGQESIVRLLINEGADVNIPSNNSMKVAPLHSAVARRSTAIVELLLNKGADVDAVQQQGVTALHAAAHNGSVDLVNILLEHGANTNLKMDDGKSAADMAKEAGFDDLAKQLENQ